MKKGRLTSLNTVQTKGCLQVCIMSSLTGSKKVMINL